MLTILLYFGYPPKTKYENLESFTFFPLSLLVLENLQNKLFLNFLKNGKKNSN